jgi:hypothetical protein
VSGEQDVARELRELASEVSALRADVRRAGGPVLPSGEHGWVDQGEPATHAWVSALGPAPRAPIRVPRLPLELAFLACAAVLAGVARLRPVEIAAVMGVAWIIVAISEWAGSRGDRMRAQLLVAPPVLAPQPVAPTPDPAWFTPPVEQTMLGSRHDAGDSATMVGPAQTPAAAGDPRDSG